jgi:hypothetical protein
MTDKFEMRVSPDCGDERMRRGRGCQGHPMRELNGNRAGNMADLALLVVVGTMVPVSGDLEAKRKNGENEENRDEALSCGSTEHELRLYPPSIVLRRTSVSNRC